MARDLVLDTSALLYWTLDRPRLTPVAERAIASADRMVVSSISIWEIALKVSHGKLILPLAVSDYVARLKTVLALELVPVDDRLWLLNVDLAWDHRDPADRTIVATATDLDCPLVTSNAVIAAFYPKTIW